MTAENVPTIGGRSQLGLEARYGEIGISAVAAALRYGGERKNPAYAPSAPPAAHRFAEPAS